MGSLFSTMFSRDSKNIKNINPNTFIDVRLNQKTGLTCPSNETYRNNVDLMGMFNAKEECDTAREDIIRKAMQSKIPLPPRGDPVFSRTPEQNNAYKVAYEQSERIKADFAKRGINQKYGGKRRTKKYAKKLRKTSRKQRMQLNH